MNTYRNPIAFLVPIIKDNVTSIKVKLDRYFIDFYELNADGSADSGFYGIGWISHIKDDTIRLTRVIHNGVSMRSNYNLYDLNIDDLLRDINDMVENKGWKAKE